MILSDEQLNSLSIPLVEIIFEFYKNTENEKEYQKWLKRREKGVCE